MWSHSMGMPQARREIGIMMMLMVMLLMMIMTMMMIATVQMMIQCDDDVI